VRKAIPSVCTSRASSPCFAPIPRTGSTFPSSSPCFVLIIRTGLSVTTSSPCRPALSSTVQLQSRLWISLYIRVRCWSARFECDDAVYDLNEISYNAPAAGERPPDFNMKAECPDRLHFAAICDCAVYQRFIILRSKKCQKSCKILREKFGS